MRHICFSIHGRVRRGGGWVKGGGVGGLTNMAEWQRSLNLTRDNKQRFMWGLENVCIFCMGTQQSLCIYCLQCHIVNMAAIIPVECRTKFPPLNDRKNAILCLCFSGLGLNSVRGVAEYVAVAFWASACCVLLLTWFAVALCILHSANYTHHYP